MKPVIKIALATALCSGIAMTSTSYAAYDESSNIQTTCYIFKNNKNIAKSKCSYDFSGYSGGAGTWGSYTIRIPQHGTYELGVTNNNGSSRTLIGDFNEKPATYQRRIKKSLKLAKNKDYSETTMPCIKNRQGLEICWIDHSML